jgi:hypothetical protein
VISVFLSTENLAPFLNFVAKFSVRGQIFCGGNVLATGENATIFRYTSDLYNQIRIPICFQDET